MFFQRLEESLKLKKVWSMEVDTVQVTITWKEVEQSFYVQADGSFYNPKTLQEAMAWIIFSFGNVPAKRRRIRKQIGA